MTLDWRDPSIHLKQIYLEKSCVGNPYGEEIIARANLPVKTVTEQDLKSLVSGEYPANLREGKKSLLLCRNQGEFLKDCPGTREYRCCDYRVLNVGLGCPMDCVYCILQAYLNTPYMSFFLNVGELFSELSAKLNDHPVRVMRIGTGEFTDSMALDRVTGLSTRLVNFFGQQKKGVLELKTKSGAIDNLQHLQHNGRTIVAWSLNSEDIITKQEIRAATLEQRLNAAARCVVWGYDCAFHFDPIISYPGWEKGYRKVIDQLFEKIPAERIVWISLGGFRYLPSLKNIASDRFPQTRIFAHEFIDGLDNKKRYFRKIRTTLYKVIYNELRTRCAPDTCIYFCMESDEIWQEIMGFLPAEKGGVGAMLDQAVKLR
ncbi:MAG: DNA photolyase [Desulfofustis sp.]|nr:DNA photolyase [Desulfofustis sp.]